jgi:hypothetical protein
MLKVIPKLNNLIVESLPLDNWYETLNSHGLDKEATALATGMNDRPAFPSGASTPKALQSLPYQKSSPFLQVPDRTPPQRGIERQARRDRARRRQASARTRRDPYRLQLHRLCTEPRQAMSPRWTLHRK